VSDTHRAKENENEHCLNRFEPADSMIFHRFFHKTSLKLMVVNPGREPLPFIL